MRFSTAFLVFLIFAFAKANFSHAQSTTKNSIPPNPKIGLVLSGGGAKGFAHIGALKVIDSLGIKVDYVSGTSMGAVVGSLYASGYTGQQLDSIFRTLDFDMLINDEVPRAVQSYFERRDDERYAAVLPFEDFSLRLPSSLSKGQNFYNLLNRLLSHVSGVEDFSRLPIPFFCMATDIESGKEVILDHGYLPRAVNASAALPSLFGPVEIDGRLLVDGGVRDNYPVKKLLDRGMEYIIGVDVQDSLRTKEQLSSALDILTQINNLGTIDAMEENRQLTDIYIHPDMDGFTVVSFDDGLEIIKRGELAARAKVNELKAFENNDYNRQPLEVNRPDKIYLDNIGIRGLKSFTRAYVTGHLDLRVPGMVSYKKLKNGINNLQATGNFTKINYTIERDGDTHSLKLDLEESSVQNYLRLGLHYDELLGSAALVGIARRNLLFDNDKASFDAILGDNLRYRLDYFIDKGNYWSIGLTSDFVQLNQQVDTPEETDLADIPLDLSSINLDYKEFNHRFYVQTHIGRGFTGRIGAEYKYLNIFTRTFGVDENDEATAVFERSGIGSVYGEVEFDNLDHASFPSEGWKVKGSLQSYLFSEVFYDGFEANFDRFSTAELLVEKAIHFGNLNLLGSFSAGAPIGDPASSSLDYFLGGYGYRPINNLVEFYGYNAFALGGDTFIKWAAQIDYEVFPKNHLLFAANFANVDDGLVRLDNLFGELPFTGYTAGYGLDTFLGPIEARYSYSPEISDGQVFVKLGYSF